jgi:hypothetical protein
MSDVDQAEAVGDGIYMLLASPDAIRAPSANTETP